MADANSHTPSPFLALTEQVGKAVTVIASLLLIVSIFFDYNFLLALGLSFDEIPSSLSEHVRSAILWAPKLFLTAFAFFIYELFLRRVEGGKSEEELIASSPAPRFIRAFRRSADWGVPLVISLIIMMGTFLSKDQQWGYLLFVLLWGALAISVVKHSRLGASLSGLRARLFIIFPILLAMVGLYGHQSGARMLAPSTPKWEVVLRDGPTNTKQSLLGIRRFGSFAITVDQSKLVSVVANDVIVSVRKLESPVQSELNICLWFGISCQSKPQPSSPSNTLLQQLPHDIAAPRP